MGYFWCAYVFVLKLRVENEAADRSNNNHHGYPLVIKHGTWKSPMNRGFNGKINKKILGFPLPCLITREYLQLL